ncbi:hypothetical protein BI049_gp126 [Salmonella phage vB_SnwM_CGG4-1]|uniref:Uncharacterized protein n=1 Tax=Salmonella phage vB_SnwM_CGG4-1 TaxID=1815631 RepID=A0A1B0VVK2_9CAUD|nr:hypothetical protein BI049_gp126 [Salmonella phage vB_SnwM_CGG4-1]ANA49607.1 hypothetical protein CGG41_253 [Salmonella phage vB_SnwM_CGG4-1]
MSPFKQIWVLVFLVMAPVFIASGVFIWEGLTPPPRVLGAICFGIAVLAVERLFFYTGMIK